MPERLVRSVQAHGLEPVMLTDYQTPAVEGCVVERAPWATKGHLVWERMIRYAVYAQPGLYVDTDIVLQRDPAPVWSLDFDVALTYRKNPIMQDGIDVTKTMPINIAVAFVRVPRFWLDVANLMADFPDTMKDWWGDQVAVAEVAKQYTTVQLPTRLYNKTTTPGQEDPSAWILHYKGARKELLP